MIDLSKGLLLENSGILLEWGKSVRRMPKSVKLDIKNRNDRTIYQWGLQKILGGLELELETGFWNFKIENLFRKFNHIESWTIGDKESESEYNRIFNHLILIYGNPTIEDIDESEKYLKWAIDKINLELYFFEQHSYKLRFSIEYMNV